MIKSSSLSSSNSEDSSGNRTYLRDPKKQSRHGNMMQDQGPGQLNFTLPTNKAITDDDSEQMKEVEDDCEDDEVSSSNTLSVSAVDEDDLRMLNQALTRDQGSRGSNDLEEEKHSATGNERS